MVNTYIARGAVRLVGNLDMQINRPACINRVRLNKTFEDEDWKRPVGSN